MVEMNCYVFCLSAETRDTYRALSEENTKLQSELSQYKVEFNKEIS